MQVEELLIVIRYHAISVTIPGSERVIKILVGYDATDVVFRISYSIFINVESIAATVIEFRVNPYVTIFKLDPL